MILLVGTERPGTADERRASFRVFKKKNSSTLSVSKVDGYAFERFRSKGTAIPTKFRMKCLKMLHKPKNGL